MTTIAVRVDLEDGTVIAVSREFAEEGMDVRGAGGEVLISHSNIQVELRHLTDRVAAALKA